MKCNEIAVITTSVSHSVMQTAEEYSRSKYVHLGNVSVTCDIFFILKISRKMQHHVAGSNKYNTWLSSPSSITIIKNKHDHKGAAGIWATASG